MQDLKEKLENDLPVEILKLNSENSLTLYTLKEDDNGRPFVDYSLKINQELEFSMFCNDVEIRTSKVAQFCTKDRKLNSCVGVLNILAHLKRMTEDKGSTSISTVEYCIKLLEKVIPTFEEEQLTKKISFLSEQLKLSIVNKYARRYTPDLLCCAAIWKNISTALYNTIFEEGILTIPAPKYLDSLTSAFKVEGTTVEGDVPQSTKQYLKSRISSLNERQKTVNIMLDEVYCSKRVEYSGGTFYGYENASVTTTILGFMIKSVAGRYHDMVALVPISKINAEVIDKLWHKILKVVTDIGFDVVSNTCDGHSANRKFYLDKLCKGELKPCIPHPFKENSLIYLPFDSVHVFKCIYNNAVNKKKFNCPPFDGQKIEPDFFHIQELYNHELGRPLKYAHRLNDTVLHPMPIEKTKVELADRFFHESTIDALDYYSENGFPQWKPTANFLRIIRMWWNTVNVKNPYMAKRKRDPVRSAISIDDTGGIQLLTKILKWVQDWWKMDDIAHGLSSETFFTLTQTTRALIGVSIHLLEVKGQNYVLLAFISSDPIEGRYGWYRQLSGANYFLSVRQFLEAEKKIRLQSLVKHSNLSFNEALKGQLISKGLFCVFNSSKKTNENNST